MSVALTVRPSDDRYNGDYGWLKSHNSFNANYDPKSKYNGFGSLRILNEDRVEPHTGFGLHPHREFEIFSYVVSGELEHKDSMGNTEIIKRGGLQMTSTGTGIRHSEYSHGEKQVHFMQIWAIPSTSQLPPTYYTRYFSDAEKRDKLLCIVAPAGTTDVSEKREAPGSAPIHAPIFAYASLLSPGKTVKHTMASSKLHLHLIQASGYNAGKSYGAQIKINGANEMREGDALFGAGTPGAEIVIENTGDSVAEFLLFDVDVE